MPLSSDEPQYLLAVYSHNIYLRPNSNIYFFPAEYIYKNSKINKEYIAYSTCLILLSQVAVVAYT